MTFAARLLVALLASLAASTGMAADWIWTSANPQHGETAWFRRSFELKEKPREASLTITADNSYALYVNDRLIGLQRLTEDWSEPDRYVLGPALKAGRNAIAVRVVNDEGSAALMVDFVAKDGDEQVRIASGADWKARRNLAPGWTKLGANPGGWQKPHVFGKAGEVAPWGALKPAKRIAGLIELKAFHERRKPLKLYDGDRVVLLGGTFFERAQRYGWLETALQTRFPKRRFTVRNLAWSADTVWADSRGIFDTPQVGYAQMIEQVRELQPTVILLNYGANEAFEGTAGLERFLAGYRQLIKDVSVTGASLVLVSPHPLIEMPKPLPSPATQNGRLQEYSSAIRQLAKEQGLIFADLWKTASGLSLSSEHTADGLHFNEAGYREISRALADAVFDGGSTATISDSGGQAELRQAIVRKNELYFHSWRPQNITYLFLFRKHEQGNNAKEVEEFRPLVEELESRIFKLKKKPNGNSN